MNESFSYLANNYNSGIDIVYVTSVAGFRVGDPILFGQIGSETAEIGYIKLLNTSTNKITLENLLRFAHPESTRVSLLRYSMVEFLWGDGPDYDALGTPALDQEVDTYIGDSTTSWTITHDGVNNRTTYTWSGAGTKPRITDYFGYPLPSAGSMTGRCWILSDQMTANNTITTLVGAPLYQVGEDFFTIGMADGTGETKITGNGYVKMETKYIDITADSFYTQFRDEVLTTGFGYFSWWNPRNHIGTIVKSPIPYLGFPSNSAKAIIDDFFSSLNGKELKLVNRDDAFRWLSEGYSLAINELNLVNKEYGGLTPFAITTVSGIAEYALPANFSRISRVWNLDNKTEVTFLPYSQANDSEEDTDDITYYLRGVKDSEVPSYPYTTRTSSEDSAEMYVGIFPTPSGATNLQVKYIPKTVPLFKNYDCVYLPNNNYYFLKDFMMFRAAPKLGRGDGTNYYSLFTNELSRMKTNIIKQDNHADSWSIARTANV